MDNDTEIVPVWTSFVDEEKQLLQYNAGIYYDFYGLLNNRSPLNVGAIKKPKNLETDGLFYIDAASRYIFEYDNPAFKARMRNISNEVRPTYQQTIMTR